MSSSLSCWLDIEGEVVKPGAAHPVHARGEDDFVLGFTSHCRFRSLTRSGDRR